jgi:hypothetical protein
MTWVLAISIWATAAAATLLWLRGATAKPSPRRALSNQSPNVAAHPAREVLVYVDAPSTEVSGGGEVWDGADPTGPAPSP